MAKKEKEAVKIPKTIVEFLDYKIDLKEKQLIANNGNAMLDFDVLEKYLRLRKYYDNKIAEIKEAK
jgi:hypothetical protein